ncbi:flavin reductase family protein [Streptomyces olivoreticuli]
MRANFDFAQLSGQQIYQLLAAVVIPRPIAWVATTSADGVDNLAPYSMFALTSIDPPIVQFTSIGRKDTLRNIEASGEFVINMAPEPLIEQVNVSSIEFPAGLSEFDAVGITREASVHVCPSRVAASPVALECRLHGMLPLGGCTVVLGRVVYAAIHEDVMVDGHPEAKRMRPLSRFGKNEWGVLPELVGVDRIRFEDWTGTAHV